MRIKRASYFPNMINTIRRNPSSLVLFCLALVLGIAGCAGCTSSSAVLRDGGLGDIRVLAIGEVVEADPDGRILALRIVDDTIDVEPGDVVVVDYSDAEVRYGCEVEFEEGGIMAVESFGLPLENPLRATRIMCRDCAFRYLIGVEAPPVGESWMDALKAQAG